MTRTFQSLDRALNIGSHVIRRSLDRRDNVADACEMEDMRGPVEHRIAGREIAYITHGQGETGIVRPVGNIALSPAAQIVKGTDNVIVVTEVIDHMRADEPGAAGHDRDSALVHAAFKRLSRRTLK